MNDNYEKLLKGLLDAKRSEMAEVEGPSKEQLKTAANSIKMFFDSFVEAGFTISQALQLTCTVVSSIAKDSTKNN